MYGKSREASGQFLQAKTTESKGPALVLRWPRLFVFAPTIAGRLLVFTHAHGGVTQDDEEG